MFKQEVGMCESERWRDVVGYEGLYQVSDLGRVRSLNRVVSDGKGGLRKLIGRILCPCIINRCGHIAVVLHKNGIGRHKLVHRLVAAAWVGPCPTGQQVRHGPNGITDNSISNLCYGTPSEDGFDRRRDGTHGGRPVRRSDGVEFINMAVAAEETGCGHQGIWEVCNGRQRTIGGYGWEYI